MKARSVACGGLLAGLLVWASSVGASAQVEWCSSDPPLQVITPGGHYLVVNNQVTLPAYAQHLKNRITDSATATADGQGGTIITVHVFVPAPAHVVAWEYRYQVHSQRDGDHVVIVYLDVPIT